VSGEWVVVVVVGVATIALKGLGPVVLGGRELPGAVMAVVRLVAPAVLAALVVVQVLGGDEEIVVDERLVGLAVGAAALILRAPLLLVVVAAAAATAVTRLLTG
jgi:branched-subunit amino acid transport protein